MAELSLVMGGFELQSGEDVLAIGLFRRAIRVSPMVMAPTLGVTLWMVVTVVGSMKRS